uniref:Uncharacterized protein n=1 Tax=Arundo donax TaxID=35708 RepID=A0A0A9BIC3_ARUDO
MLLRRLRIRMFL